MFGGDRGQGTADDNLQSMLGDLQNLDTDEIADMFVEKGEDIIDKFMDAHDDRTYDGLMQPLKERFRLAQTFAAQWNEGLRVVEYLQDDGVKGTTSTSQGVRKNLEDMVAGFKQIIKLDHTLKRAHVTKPDQLPGRASEQQQARDREFIQRTADWVTNSIKDSEPHRKLGLLNEQYTNRLRAGRVVTHSN